MHLPWFRINYLNCIVKSLIGQSSYVPFVSIDGLLMVSLLEFFSNLQWICQTLPNQPSLGRSYLFAEHAPFQNSCPLVFCHKTAGDTLVLRYGPTRSPWNALESPTPLALLLFTSTPPFWLSSTTSPLGSTIFNLCSRPLSPGMLRSSGLSSNAIIQYQLCV